MRNPIRSHIAICLLLHAFLLTALYAQPRKDLLGITEDHSASLDLAPNWNPAPVKRDQDGKIREASFRLLSWHKAGKYTPKSDAPELPKTLLGRPFSSMLSVLEGRPETKLNIAVWKHLVVVTCLKDVPARHASKREKNWIASATGKKPPRGKLRRDEHALLWAYRAKHMQAQWKDLMGLTEGCPTAVPDSYHYPKYINRGELWVFQDLDHYREVCRQFFKSFGEKATWWFLNDSEQVVTFLPIGESRPEIIHARLDHLLAYHFTIEYRGYTNAFPKWLIAGLGHWFERRHKKFENTYLINGLPSQDMVEKWRWKTKNWWTHMRKVVSTNKELPIALISKSTTIDQRLSPEHRCQGWSMVTYMLSMGRQRWRQLVESFKGKTVDDLVLQVQNDALQKAYGANGVQFVNFWKKWVAKAKPTRR